MLGNNSATQTLRIAHPLEMQNELSQWTNIKSPDNYLNKAQVIMNTAARWATGLPRRTRISRLLEITGWFSIREQIKIATIVQIWKLVHYGKPNRLLEIMEIEDNLDITVENPRLQISKRSFRWRGTEEWNKLPKNLREMNSIGTFKKYLKLLVKKQREPLQGPRAPD